MAAVSTLLLRSARMAGEKTRGDTLDSNEQSEMLDEINSMLDNWSIQKLMCYTVQQDTHLLTASTSSYTIGPGATINTTRPTKIVDPCWVRDSNGYDYPLKVINLETYGTFTDKTSGATIPSHLYYDMGYSATSTATLTVYPPPSVGLTLFIHSWKQLQQFASVTTQVLFPPGYRLAIESNFAIHLCAGFRRPDPEVLRIARDSMAAIKNLNSPALISRIEGGARPGIQVDHGIYIDSDYIE